MSEQLPLFPIESASGETPRTKEEIAAHIGAHARTDFDPNQRAAERTRRRGAGGGIASHLEGYTPTELTPEERGAQLGAAFMEDPDRFGSDWPSARLNRQANQEASQALARQPSRKLYEMPGQNRGRSNFPPPTRAEILEGMSKDDIDRQQKINKAGAVAARQALNETLNDKSKDKD